MIIELKSISKSFISYSKFSILNNLFLKSPESKKITALSNVNLEIKHGEVWGIIGRNGAGKSTLLQIVCGTLTPSSGSISIDNQNINYYIDYIINSLFEANKYFNDQEPWKMKNDPVRLDTIVYTTLEIVRKVSFLLFPIIPESSLKALKIFSLEEKDIKLSSIEENDYLIKGKKINKINILFNKIEKND